MSENRYVKHENIERDKIFESLIIFSIISVLIYVGVNYYTKPIASSQVSIIEHHAGIFSRMVLNIHAVGVSLKKSQVTISDSVFNLNENGWPANTEGNMSPSIRNQTDRECQQIWESIFANAPSSELIVNAYKKKVGYVISLNKNVICRYQLARKQEGSYFFDYDVSSGAVTVFRPEGDSAY